MFQVVCLEYLCYNEVIHQVYRKLQHYSKFMDNSPSCFYVIVKSFLKGLAVAVGLPAVSVGG